ncbi:MAG: HhH-GPD family protein [Endomicrobiales bacterium]
MSAKKNQLSPAARRAFQKKLYGHFREHGRSFSWRAAIDPYRIFVSEVMLQQTQTDRVEKKFREFVSAFPDFKALAEAPLKEVLAAWQGMGYNRRALYLKQAAQEIMRRYGGKLPADVEALDALPGIGAATARSIAAFAFNAPVVFIETNVRAVFIHEFFRGREKVPDAEILPLVTQTLDVKNPSAWYNALMDYGVMLKGKHPNPSRRSAHYKKQSPFLSSDRRVRGIILRLASEKGRITEKTLRAQKGCPLERVRRCLRALVKDGLLLKNRDSYVIP